MISRLSGCCLRRKGGGRVARDESCDVDRRRAATGLARALARPAQLFGVGECPAQLLGGDGAGAAGLGPITALGMGARDQHARQRSGARPRVVQTDTFARAQMMATGRGPSAHVVARMSCTARFWHLIRLPVILYVLFKFKFLHKRQTT